MYEPFMNTIVLEHLTEFIIIAIICTAVAFFATGCTKNSDDNSSEESTSITAVSDTETKESAPLDTVDTPETASKKKQKTPYDFPYNTDKIEEELLSYGESLGLYYDKNLKMKQAESIVKIQTRLAEDGKTLQRWCKEDIDSIVAQANYRNIDVDEVSFNITIIDSTTYKGEYTIVIFSEN